jgi:predicted amidohydrolase YtcJ
MERNAISNRKGLVLVNARVLTLEEDSPVAEAVVTDGERLLYVGKRDSLTPELFNDREVIDLKGRTVVPGFIDSHIHLLELARSHFGLDLAECKSIKALLRLLKEEGKRLPKGQWLLGYHWDESRWEEGRHVTLEELDRACPDNPVFLKRICLHQALVNSLALERIDFGRGDPSASGGRPYKACLVHGETKARVESCLEFPQEKLLENLEEVQKKLLALGITSVHQISSNFSLIKEFAEGDRLLLRVNFCPTWEEKTGTFKAGWRPGEEMTQSIRFGAIKFFTDGSLGAHSASLLAPYSDDPDNQGQLYWEAERLKEILTALHTDDHQLSLHAIGDRAILFVLDVLESVLERDPRKNHRHRLEHCELVPKGAIERIKRLGLVVSAQPNFISMWGLPGGLYEKRLGLERWKRMNPLSEFLRASIPLVFGSDGMPPGPLYGIHSAVNHPVETSRLSPMEALACYTRAGAYSSFEEGSKGTVRPGKLADLVVLSHDPMTCPRGDIKNIVVLLTVLGGKIVYNNLKEGFN